ncbi:hypothetical protein LIER_10383 [Lithospermum erythrorhizon]|uniref:Uncharacterized protein n=1 Tax=Lithospermum erythrorhizon TaxID=34254 RepID=A0AAV3PND5_LITER
MAHYAQRDDFLAAGCPMAQVGLLALIVVVFKLLWAPIQPWSPPPNLAILLMHLVNSCPHRSSSPQANFVTQPPLRVLVLMIWVTVANGQQLHISHTGSGNSSTPSLRKE